eukprot:scaffold6544_cov112-Cylindrotheca_fusiformis.AAC.5
MISSRLRSPTSLLPIVFLLHTAVLQPSMSASSLVQLASFSLSKNVSLRLLGGSVTDFVSRQSGAIVNAANEGCLGGGGVDGAIGNAGGESLFQDRAALPVLDGRGIRCRTGSAVLTGPGNYGTLQVPYVIHAVGPNYWTYDNFSAPDQLLRSAYQQSLDIARENSITEVAFSLLSAGVFRGERDLETILRIAVSGIWDWVNETKEGGALESVCLVAFSKRERNLLEKITRGILEEKKLLAREKDDEVESTRPSSSGIGHTSKLAGAPSEDNGLTSPIVDNESCLSDEQSYPSDEEPCSKGDFGDKKGASGVVDSTKNEL